MKLIIAIAFLFASYSCVCQPVQKIFIGSVDKIYSKILGEERTIWVYNPGEVNHANTDRYPVLYLMDAEDHFFATVGMVKQMSGSWPEMIVVGITNTNRFRDLTPTISNTAGIENKNPAGGANFMQFIEKELMPHIDSVYPTAPYKIFSGHSLGGLTVIHTLLNNPHLFNAFIALDPALWWNNQQLVKDAKKDLLQGKYKNISLFIGRAKNMPQDMDTLTALRDATSYTEIFRTVTQFIKELKAAGDIGLRWDTKFYPEEIHGTVQLNAQYDALKFLFNYYQFRTSVFELNPDMNIDSALTAHYKIISDHFGYKVNPPKSLVNSLGYSCISLKKWNKAAFFFKLNIENYPQDANGYDSIGELYEASGDTKKAIESYTKALTLGNDPDTKRKLERLQIKK